MRGLRFLMALALVGSSAFAQPPTTTRSFEVASVRPCQHTVGPDYNNQITYTPAGLTARNATLKRLVAEAWTVQVNQVVGPGWLNQNEYDIEARAPQGASKEQIASMLRNLLAERFQLKQHAETRQMRPYELVVGNTGPKIRPIGPGEAIAAQPGFHFRGDMRQFADVLAVQFSIPASNDPTVPARAGGPPILVLDKTGLQGTYEFSVNLPPELGTDAFTTWNRALADQLGLKIQSRRDAVAVVIVDSAARIPIEN